MATVSIPDVRVAAVSACVPNRIERNADFPFTSAAERNLFIKTTGVQERRIAPEQVTSADLCYEAASVLLTDHHVRDEIDAVVMVTQSGDFRLPASSILLQDRLGLSRKVLAFDISLGCSGYVYGLAVVSGLIRSMRLRKALLLAGDVSSRVCFPQDRVSRPLFGDAGSATLLESVAGAPPLLFNLFSDGAGFQAIMVPHGGARYGYCEGSLHAQTQEDGGVRRPLDLHLRGTEIFEFAVREVPASIDALLEQNNLCAADMDCWALHQANKLINDTIIRKLRVDQSRVPFSLEHFGNTSSASIPLTLVTHMSHAIDKEVSNGKTMMSGFGVGLSWANAIVDLTETVFHPLVEYVENDGQLS